MLGDTLACSGQRVLTDRAQRGTPAWTTLSPSPMICMNPTERKMNSVFGAYQSLRSVLTPSIRKLRQPTGMVGTSHWFIPGKKVTEKSLGKSMKARSLKYLRDISVGRQKQGIRPVAQPLSLKTFGIAAMWWWTPADSGLPGFRLL